MPNVARKDTTTTAIARTRHCVLPAKRARTDCAESVGYVPGEIRLVGGNISYLDGVAIVGVREMRALAFPPVNMIRWLPLRDHAHHWPARVAFDCRRSHCGRNAGEDRGLPTCIAGHRRRSAVVDSRVPTNSWDVTSGDSSPRRAIPGGSELARRVPATPLFIGSIPIGASRYPTSYMARRMVFGRRWQRRCEHSSAKPAPKKRARFASAATRLYPCYTNRYGSGRYAAANRLPRP